MANKLTGRAVTWFVNVPMSMTSEKKMCGYLKHLLQVEYAERLELNQVLVRLNKRTMKSNETLNEYVAALREIGQNCRELEERWYVNAFTRGVHPYAQGLVIAASPKTLGDAKQYAINVAGRYGLGKDVTPEDIKPSRKADEDTKAATKSEPGTARNSGGSDEQSMVMVPVLNPQTGFLMLKAMPMSEAQVAMKNAVAVAMPAPPMNWNIPKSYTVPLVQYPGQEHQQLSTGSQFLDSSARRIGSLEDEVK